MEIGASSACFYPLETERSFLHIAELGFNHCEIFFNAHFDLSPKSKHRRTLAGLLSTDHEQMLLQADGQNIA